jgi:hypothetical protein
MFKKIIFCFIGLASILLLMFLTLSSPSIAQAPSRQSTMWGVADKSLTELLDSGWKITNQSSYRVFISRVVGIRRQLEETDAETHVYLLYKNGKNISCFLDGPSPNEAYSKCRRLN